MSETTTDYANVTVYLKGEFLGNIIRQDVRELTVTTGVKYAQYNNATRVTYVAAGKRKRRGVVLMYKPFLVVLARADAIEPEAMYKKLSSTGEATVSVSAHHSFSPNWTKDFNERLAAAGVTPLLSIQDSEVE